jgi:phosphoribosylformylglycinamidine cyclo-ligase
LLEPTRIYVRSLLPLVQQRKVKGLAHITGGGLLENIPRILPDSCHAIVTMDWPALPVFELLRQGGNVAPEEMARTFNCGVGMALIVSPQEADDVAKALHGAGEAVERMGRIEAGPRGCTVSGPSGSWSATHNA